MILLQEAATGTHATGLFDIVNKLGSKFFIRLGIDLITVTILIRVIYMSYNKKHDFIFTYYTFNLIIFLITFLLNKVEMSMGAAFGLFAVFSMLRYRTEDILMKDMTYLFLCIALGLINAVAKGDWEPASISAIVLLITFILDSNIIFKKELVKVIQYENIGLILPENKDELLEDLRKRTGLNIHRVDIGEINFLRDAATIRVYYYEAKTKRAKLNKVE
jgi:hypothetical protein